MKKRILGILLIAILALSIFTGCASGSKDSMSSGSAPDYNNSGDWIEETDPSYDSSVTEDYIEGGGLSQTELNKNTISSTSPNESLAEKMIYRATVEIETLKFDESVESVYAMLDSYGAFIENSSVTGTDYNSKYYGWASYRTAEFTIRVPKENFSKMLDSMSVIGNVTYSTTASENITTQYTDVESRLKAYRTEEAQLLTMLEKCETVEDMITVQSRLSDVRYEIEYLTSMLNNWDTEVNYSTIYLTLQEVKELSEEVTATKTYWEDVRDTLSSSLKSIGTFFKGFLKYFIAALPVLLIMAVIAVIVILIIRGAIRHSRKKRLYNAPQNQSGQSSGPNNASSSFKDTKGDTGDDSKK